MNHPDTPVGVQPWPLGPGAAVLTFDVRSTQTKAALFDTEGVMLGLSRTMIPAPTAAHDATEALMAHVEDLTTQFARDFPLVTPSATGLIAQGIVDDKEGIAILSAGLRWANVPYKRLAEHRLRLPSSFSNVARAVGEAEFTLGAGRTHHNAMVIKLGSRIAASLFVDGRSHDAGGFAGGLGHTIVNPQGDRCVCGSRGCLQTVASSGALLSRYTDLTGETLAAWEDVLTLSRKGDAAAERVWNDALDALALAISHVAAILAPEAVVISGGLATIGDEFFVPLRQRVDALLSFHRRPLLVPAMFGQNAGLIGAALRARAATTA
ncbi:ROK family protein [Cryobacterium roopkundense]|uniref:Glucokinase n=1 Tax=Cryobacterium roopkundense TaxID=1001240 RepID=A0A7W8ZY05_9MICO|nr:ROK family protein [Cryobacterium roopkundense]MBB5642334.1 glucokinase [Cryobacterium roopkundense]